MVWVAASTLGFIPPWLFLNHAFMLLPVFNLDWAQVVGYGSWFLVASTAGRLLLRFPAAEKIRLHVAIAALSLILSGLIVAVLPNPMGILVAIFLSASINGSIFFGPVIVASIQHFPGRPSLAVAFATVGQLTAAAVSKYLSSLATEISPVNPISVVLLAAGVLLLFFSRFILVPRKYPAMDIERDAGRLIGIAFAFCGFCVTAAGTSFIFVLSATLHSSHHLAVAVTLFSLSALVGRIGFAYLYDILGYPMQVVSATAMAVSCVSAFFLLGAADGSWVPATAALFGIGYGGITPTYLAKQRSLFSGASARHQSQNFFVFASAGILAGSVSKLFFSGSVMSAFSMTLAILNVLVIFWISNVRTSIYSRADHKDFGE